VTCTCRTRRRVGVLLHTIRVKVLLHLTGRIVRGKEVAWWLTNPHGRGPAAGHARVAPAPPAWAGRYLWSGSAGTSGPGTGFGTSKRFYVYWEQGKRSGSESSSAGGSTGKKNIFPLKKKLKLEMQII
jgi:hypothetical protein